MKLFLLVVALYLFLYTPVFTFIGVDSMYFLYPLLLLFFIPKYRKGINKYHNVLKTWVVLFIFVFARTLLGGESFFLISTIGILLESILLSYIIVKIAILNDINLERSLLIVSSIAAVISSLCLFIPDFNLFIKSILVNKNEYLEDNFFRGFGLADQLTYFYGLIQGFICAFGIIYLNKYRWFLFFIPFVILSVLINVRTGFIPIAISVIINIVVGKQYNYIFYCLFAAFIILYLWNNVLTEFMPQRTMTWINMFFEELTGLFTDGKKDSGTIDALSNMIILPETPQDWFLGKGYSIFRGVGRGNNSDIGYIIQLNYGGIVYCFLLFCLVASIYKKCRKTMKFSFIVTMIFSALLMNYKGVFFGHNSAFALTVLLIIYSIEMKRINIHKNIT